MAKKFITKETGHYRINGMLRSILQDCTAEKSDRYALEHVLVEPEKLVASDGKRMVVVSREHGIPPGIYYVTEDGFLLKAEDNYRFPKYRDILLDDAEVKVTVIPSEPPPEVNFGVIVAHLNREGMIFDVLALSGVLLPGIGDRCCSVKTISPDRPFQIEFDIGQQTHIIYIQMPVNA